MSTSSSLNRSPGSNNGMSHYGALIPFASQGAESSAQTTKRRNLVDLPNDLVGHIFGFLSLKDLGHAERICQGWKRFIEETEEWKERCRIQLNSGIVDPGTYLPACGSYKEGLLKVLSRVYDESAYRRYLGAETESAGRIPFLRRFNAPDPCDSTSTVGEQYVWIYSPPYFKISLDESFPVTIQIPPPSSGESKN